MSSSSQSMGPAASLMQASEPSTETSPVHELSRVEREAREEEAASAATPDAGGVAAASPPGVIPTAALTDVRRLRSRRGDQQSGVDAETVSAVAKRRTDYKPGYQSGQAEIVLRMDQPAESSAESLRVERTARRAAKQQSRRWRAVAAQCFGGHRGVGGTCGVQAGGERASDGPIGLRGQQAHGQLTRQRSRHPNCVPREVERAVCQCLHSDGRRVRHGVLSADRLGAQTYGRAVQAVRAKRQTIRALMPLASTGSGMISRPAAQRLLRTHA